ncbi:MRN complex-interacting protein [Chelmon rostratus]|uniref:MRN complex-interacting protein n=1 Tax=Chelmon rostratus TaxID=109905 RepID=UPI001BE7BC85|nr:MRN complex-interacting protein [Chelmon rostratus]
MVQEFHVLRCFSCQIFQVQQVKKANRWTCKLCGEKQSLLKEFGRGSGADCRLHVQKLNAMRGAVLEEQEHNIWSQSKQVEEDREDEPEEHRADQGTPHPHRATRAQTSCWSKYLDAPEEAEPEEEEEEEEHVLMDKQQLHGNNMIDRKRKRKRGWTDRGGEDGWTPEQSNWSSLMKKPVRLSATTRTEDLNHWSSPTKKNAEASSVSGGSFLSSDCQVNDEPSSTGRSQSAGRAASLCCNDIIHQTPPTIRPHPLLPVSSMFESSEDFSFDEFLTAEKL